MKALLPTTVDFTPPEVSGVTFAPFEPDRPFQSPPKAK